MAGGTGTRDILSPRNAVPRAEDVLPERTFTNGIGGLQTTERRGLDAAGIDPRVHPVTGQKQIAVPGLVRP